ncbi:MAG: wax ester/triacylglycerol synthase family O-acyltransferase [Solirubrobacteraceae bacterium]|jgi:WS/DGAT/MGAT family acyltransferase
MTQQHLDRLTALDASFLHQEGPESHMHIGALTTFDGPPPQFGELLELIAGRLHLVPRYRQRLARTPFDRGRPVWIDDAAFRLEYHVRHVALPSPGGRDELLTLLSRIYSTQLDRRRPLWEMWFVEGLEDGGFALIFKTHHAVIDGIAGLDLATVIFDLESEAGDSAEPPPEWTPGSNPGQLGLMALGAVRDARDTVRLLNGALTAGAHPQESVRRLRDAAGGLAEIAWAALNPAPETPLNVPIGPYRRFVTVSARLEDFKAIKNAFGGTVNDVVLAVVTGALRSFLQSRGVRTEGLELRALVPVSLRGAGDGGDVIGNRLAAMRGSLPVYIADPRERLEAVRVSMDGIKESRQALGAEVLAGVQNFAPPTILAQASRINFSTRLFNLLVTNMPGPQIPLHVLGREIREVYPIGFLAHDHALAVAIMSYNGQLNFGLLADSQALPELDRLAGWVSEAIEELLALARAAAAPAD